MQLDPSDDARWLEPELTQFAWPQDVTESERNEVARELFAEREAHRKALVPFWHSRIAAMLRARGRSRP